MILNSASADAQTLPATVFYVDADWHGASLGTAAQPFTNFHNVTWTGIIAPALSNGPVTIYFNSRQQGTNVGLSLSAAPATAFGTYPFILDGKSYYNASENKPNWQPETNPTNLANVYFISSEDLGHQKRSLVTVHGFCLCAPSTKAVAIAGDNWIVELCDISSMPNSTSGPTILVVSTADSAHQGSSSWTPSCTNILIRTNSIHDTYAEGIYVGGGGLFTNWYDVGAGYPSHSNIWIQGNTIYRTAYHSSGFGPANGQGDGIDIKGGLDNVTVEGNNIYAINDPTGNGVRPLVMQGQTNGGVQLRIVRNNYIHDCLGVVDSAISVGNGWGVAQGVQIYNNVIANIQGGGVYGTNGDLPNGIKVYQSQDAVQIYNNTIFNCAGPAICAYVTNAPIIMMNNLCWGNNSNGVEVNFKPGNPVTSDYNAYGGTWGFSGEGIHSMAMAPLQASNNLVNIAVNNFAVAAGSPIVGMALPLNSVFKTDMAGNIRGNIWDMGAMNNYPLLRPPTGFHIVHY